jgi:hypothetical protein
MTRNAATSELVRYEDDYCAWLCQQIGLLEARRFGDIDVAHLANELRSLAVSEEGEIESRLAVLLHHLLKWEFQPAGRTKSWRASIIEQRNRINRIIRRSPSLRRHPAAVLGEEYVVARLRAADETELPLNRFPAACPYSAADALDAGFWPGERPSFED